jgi:hypothetical protein
MKRKKKSFLYYVYTDIGLITMKRCTDFSDKISQTVCYGIFVFVLSIKKTKNNVKIKQLKTIKIRLIHKENHN